MTTEEQTLAAYRGLKAKLGRVPSNGELADALCLNGTDGGRKQQASKLRQPLIAKGLAEAGPRGGPGGRKPATGASPAAIAARATPKPTAPRTAPLPASRTTSSDPTVASLIVKRDRLLTAAAALNTAIDALSEAM